MRIITTARHCEIDPEDRLYAEQHIAKLSRFARDISEVHLVVSTENYRHTAEITTVIAGREFKGRETADAVRAAITAAAGRLEHQVRRLKDLRLERRRGDRTRAADAMEFPGGGNGSGDADELGGTPWEE